MFRVKYVKRIYNADDIITNMLFQVLSLILHFDLNTKINAHCCAAEQYVNEIYNVDVVIINMFYLVISLILKGLVLILRLCSINSHCCAAERFRLLSFGERVSRDNAFKEKTTTSKSTCCRIEHSGRSMNTHLLRTLIL